LLLTVTALLKVLGPENTLLPAYEAFPATVTALLKVLGPEKTLLPAYRASPEMAREVLRCTRDDEMDMGAFDVEFMGPM
jgi:hypothetical protein